MKHSRIFSFLIVVAAFFFVPALAHAASLALSPAAGTFSVGTSFTVNVVVSSPDQSMNAVSGVVSFPTAQLQVLSVSESASIVTFWVQNPSFSNQDGTVTFEGVVLAPGFTGNAGTVVSIVFRVKAAGTAPLSFQSGSLLANDGQGTNILDSLGVASYTLRAAASLVSSPVSTVSPASVSIHLALTRLDTKDPTNPQPQFSLGSVAGLSGAVTVQIKINDGSWFQPSGSLQDVTLPLQAPGTHTIFVRAVNKAGQTSIAQADFQVTPLPPPIITLYTYGGDTSAQALSALNNATELTVAGEALADSVVYITVNPSGTSTGNHGIIFSAPVNSEGDWSANDNADLTPGTWIIKAYIMDGRGALSHDTLPVVLTVVNPAQRILDTFLQWGKAVFVLLLIVFILAFVALSALYALRRLRLRLRKNLLNFKKELQQELTKFDDDAVTGKAALKKEVGVVEKKIEAEIERVDDLGQS